MMIRSQPPASAHLAESPVPAPAPMIGRPASICARRRSDALQGTPAQQPPHRHGESDHGQDSKWAADQGDPFHLEKVAYGKLDAD